MDFEVNLLDDSPSNEDAFSQQDHTGPHERVARAIAKMVSTEGGGKAIGLEGEWGSGKSTVVAILKRILGEDSNRELIIFDAWAHAGDPLRRTFLETLIGSLIARKWLDEESWGKQLELLANRLKITSSNTIPQPTHLGQAFAAAVMLTPVGIVLLRDSLASSLTFALDTQLPIAWQFVFGLTFSVGPLIIWAISLLLAYFKPAAAHAGALLLNHTITRHHTETTESPNPTSIEFERLFVKALQEALSSPSRKIVLVLDNLDRVDADDVGQIWSTMQTFLHGRFRNDSSFEGLWILIPYDRAGLLKRFPVAESGSPPNVTHGSTYLDKCLQVRFAVPPLVLSDWKAYLDRLLTKSLPGYSESDHHAVFRVFDRLRESGKSPTPRALKLFVNQIGSFHRQWSNSVPPEHIAYFVLRFTNTQQSIDDLLRPKIPELHLPVLQRGADRLVANLAGLAFNVESSKGLQLLLSQPIQDALAKCDSGALRELATNHSDGFWLIAEYAIETHKDKSPLAIASIATCLFQSQLLDGNIRPEAAHIREMIKAMAIQIEAWHPFDESVSRGLIALCKIIEDDAVPQLIVDAAAKTIQDTTAQKLESPSMIVQQILQMIHEIPIESTETQFRIPSELRPWIDTCVELRRLDPQGVSWNRFLPTKSFPEVVHELQDAAESARFDSRALDTVVVTAAVATSAPASLWKSLVKGIRERIAGSPEIALQEAAALLEALCELCRLEASRATESRTELVNSGRITHYCHRARAEGNVNLQAVCLYLYLSERPDASKNGSSAPEANVGYGSFTDALRDQSAELASSFVERLSRSGDLKLLWSVVEQRNVVDPLIAACVQIAVDRPDREKCFSCQNIRRSWQALADVSISGHDVALLSHVIRKCEMSEALRNEIVADESGFKRNEARFYRLVLECSANDGASSFAQWCASNLARFDASAWKQDLTSSFECIALLLRLRECGTVVALSTQYADAVVEHAGHTMSGAHGPPADLLDKWDQVPQALVDSAIRRTMQGRILSSLQALDGEVHPLFFETYGGELVSSGALKEDGMTVLKVFSPLLRRWNVVGIDWVCEVLQADTSFLDTHSERASVAEFRKRIQESEPPDEMLELRSKLARLAGLQ